MPAIYINSLLATTNDNPAVEADGVRRSINRGRVRLADIPRAGGSTWQSRIYTGLIERATVRRQHRAFHPDGGQELRDLNGVLSIRRTTLDDTETVRVLCNLTDRDQMIEIDTPSRCLLDGTRAVETVTLGPYKTAWLVADPAQV